MKETNKAARRQIISKIANVCEKTVFNWEKEKPELIRAIELGIEAAQVQCNKKPNNKEICADLGIDQNTIRNWERNRPKLYKIVMNHYFRKGPDFNGLIEQLPEWKQQKFYHLIMAEILEELGPQE